MDTEGGAVAILGDFVFFAGNPQEEIVKFKPDGCKFCEIINGNNKAHIVYEDNLVVSFLDIDPINEGHVLIVPREHSDAIYDLPDETLSRVMQVSKKMVLAFKDITLIVIGCSR